MISIGEIYKVPLGVDDDITPKDGYDTRDKFCAVIAMPDYGLVVAYVIFDHEINEKYNNTPQLKSNFYPVRSTDYPEFLKPKYDPSWIDLNKIREMDPNRMASYGPPVGCLSDVDLKLVRTAIAENDFQFSKKQRRRWGLIE